MIPDKTKIANGAFASYLKSLGQLRAENRTLIAGYIAPEKTTKCDNCGAPRKVNKCEYCGG